MNAFHLLESRGGKKKLNYGLFPVTTGFTMATVCPGLCVRRSEAGDPVVLGFSVTHNINHFIEVGQILLESHLKWGGVGWGVLRLVAVTAPENSAQSRPLQQEAAAAERLPAPAVSSTFTCHSFYWCLARVFLLLTMILLFKCQCLQRFKSVCRQHCSTAVDCSLCTW